MTKGRFARISTLFLVACGAISSLSAEAEIRDAFFTCGMTQFCTKDGKTYEGQYPAKVEFPFNTQNQLEAEGFYNGMSWADGSRREFINFRNCTLDNYEYSCHADYIQINARGSRTCINARLYTNAKIIDKTYGMTADLLADGESGYTHDDKGEESCGPYTEVSSQPEVDEPSDRPPTPMTTPSHPADVTLKDYQVIIGGTSLFLLGGIVGMLFRRVKK